MPNGREPIWGLSLLTPSGSLAEDGYKILDADRRTIASLLLAAFRHHHDGATTIREAENEAPTLDYTNAAGALPGGQTLYYRFSLVDETGMESAASAIAQITLPDVVAEPSAPALTVNTLGGTLLSGRYLYALSAYVNDNPMEETRMGPAQPATVPATTTGQVTITPPDLPDGATGFNLYRLAANQTSYYRLASFDPADLVDGVFVDDGTIDFGALVRSPDTNRTNLHNSVYVTYPGATPAVPEGYTWKVYRTSVYGSWNNSFLHHVTEETTDGSGIRAVEFIDNGYPARQGTPILEPFANLTNPDPIDLATETQGALEWERLGHGTATLIDEAAGSLPLTVTLTDEDETYAIVAISVPVGPGTVNVVLPPVTANSKPFLLLLLCDGGAGSPMPTLQVGGVPAGDVFANPFALGADHPWQGYELRPDFADTGWIGVRITTDETLGAPFRVDIAPSTIVPMHGLSSPADVISITLTDNISGWDLHTGTYPHMGVVTHIYTQDGTGGRDIVTDNAGSANIVWAAGSAPTLDGTPGKSDIIRFTQITPAGSYLGEVIAAGITIPAD